MQNHYSTERLILDILDPADHVFITNLVNTPGWLEFIGDRYVKTEEEARGYIKRIIENPSINYWVVRFKSTKTSIGVITFIKRDYLEYHDIGFAFLPEYSGMGYAYEAARVVMDDALHDPANEFILATTKSHNSNSIKLLGKLGLRFEKEIDINGEQLMVYSTASKTDLSQQG